MLFLVALGVAMSARCQSPDCFNPNMNGSVYGMAVQGDGKVLLGGLGIARFQSDGTLDNSFSASANGSVTSLILQPDGKIVVAGGFSILDGQSCTNIGRLNGDGSVDTNFNPGASSAVNALAVQADGKILVAGAFTNLAGQPRKYLGGLNPDGSPDPTFNPAPPYSYNYQPNQLNSIALQPDGKIVVGGSAFVYPYSVPFLVRLTSNGALDSGFGLQVGENPTSGAVDCLAIQGDGKILAGGNLTWDYSTFSNLVRLAASGATDSTFNPGANSTVSCLAVQRNGKILLGGSFSALGGQSRANLGRINSDGSLDGSFNPGANAGVYSLALQTNGAIFVAGAFTNLNGQLCTCIGALSNNDLPAQSITFDGSTITWSQEGSMPEIWGATFDASTNSVDWFSLGDGQRIPNGWAYVGVSLPTNSTIRARGFTAGGQNDGSGSYFETIAATFTPPNLQTPPVILTTDGGFGFRTNGFGFNVSALAGQVVVIEASTNLVNWTPLQTNLVTSLGIIMFNDANSHLFQRRFYRARLYEGALPPPTIGVGSGTVGGQGGKFLLNVSGIGGQTVVIETSTNLLTWTPLDTNTLGIGTFYFSDSGSTNSPWRFYRAVWVP